MDGIRVAPPRSPAALRLSRKRAILLGVGLLAILGLGARLLLDTPAEKPARADAAAVSVEVAPVTRADVPVTLDGLGSVQAFNTVTITPRVDGELRTVAFTEGQTVQKGDLLAEIDPRPFRAALDQALAVKAKDQATLTNARRDLVRYQALAPRNFTSKQTVDTQATLVAQLEAQVKADEAIIENARTQLDYTRITAPIPGRTGIRLVDAGNIVHPSQTAGIVVITQLQPISVVFTLPEDDLPALSKAIAAGPVTVTALSRDLKTELDRGSLALIDNQIDPTTGTIRAKATFANKHNTLWPGEFVNARVLIEIRHHAMTVPSTAIQRGPNGVFAYVVSQDMGPGGAGIFKVEARLLKIAEESGATTLVEDGLKDGEKVVTANQYRLQPGVLVRVRGPKKQ